MSEKNVLFATEDQIEDSEQLVEVDTSLFLVFVTGGLRFGASADYVVEIITDHSITKIPNVPSYIRGIINLRGQLVPIIDMCLRLGKPADEENLVIVLDIEGTMIGILVNRVDQMIPVPVDSILPMPANSQEKMVTGMCTLPDSNDTMLVLDCPLLIHD